MTQKFVLVISGPSCSGKSTLEAELGKLFPGAYNVAFDKLKWQLAGYTRGPDREVIRKLAFGFFEVVCKNDLSIFLQIYMHSEEEFLTYTDVAEKYGYKIVAVELTAPTDVDFERFRNRVISAARQGTNISVKDESIFLKELGTSGYVPPGTPVFDSSKLKPEEIAAEVAKLINSD